MKRISGLFAVLALAGLSCPAFAQGLPPGSYQRSCSDIRVHDRTMIAVCRDAKGRMRQTALDISRCAGDIANSNGQLQCNGGRAVAPRSGPPGYAGPGSPAPGYPPSGYPPPPYDQRGSYREHCEALRHEAHELYQRLEHTPYGEHREYLEHRLNEINYQRQECRHH
jgi:hypothetical protein